MKTPMKPKDMFLSLMHLDFSKEQCIEEDNNKAHSIAIKKEQLKKEIQTMLKDKMEFLQLIEKKSQLKQNLS